MNAYIVLRKSIAALLAFALFGGIAGCANVAATNMVPESFGSAKRFDKTTQVVVDTTKANDHFKGWVVDAEFKTAIEQSLLKAKVFKDVRQAADSDYQLRVTVTSIGNFWGLEARVAVNTTWEIIDVMRQTPIWKDVVQSEGVATVGDALGGATRVKIMYEPALKENVSKGIGQLSASL